MARVQNITIPITINVSRVIHVDPLPVEPPEGSVAVFRDDKDGDLIPMKRLQTIWVGRHDFDHGSWSELLNEFGGPVEVIEPW